MRWNFGIWQINKFSVMVGMINMVIFIGIISVIIFALYFRDLKRNPITTKKMIIIAMMSGLSFMLGLIQFVKYHQGGGIT